MRSQKIKEFTLVNDCFSDKRNEEVGFYGQTLIRKKFMNKEIQITVKEKRAVVNYLSGELTSNDSA
ncbi:MAG: hypothetical protein L3J11_12520, partial [Draconibacterium sp.]|nr:hypothetical protein [Draconibacterium sp.]